VCVFPCRRGPRIGAAVLLGGGRQVQQRRTPAHVVILAADDDKGLGLQVEPALGDGRGCPSLHRLDKLEHARGVLRAGRFGVVLPPHVPGDGRQDTGQIAKHELQIEDGALLLSAARGFQGGVDVPADPAEEDLIGVGIAPAQVGVEHISREVVREQAVRSRLHEGQVAQPREQLVGILERERVPQERLVGHSGQRAHLQAAALQARGDDVDEPPDKRGDEVGCQRAEGRLPAPHDHVGEQGKPERVTMGDLDQAVVDGRIDPASSQVAAALLRIEVAQRDDPQELPPRRVGAPCRARQLSARHHRQRGGGQAGQQRRAHPVVQGAQLLERVEQQEWPTLCCGERLVTGGRTECLSYDIECRARRGRQVAPVEPDDACATGLLGVLGDGLKQTRLADSAWTREPQHGKRRLGGVERCPDKLKLAVTTDKAPTPARCQDLAERQIRKPTLGHGALGRRGSLGRESRLPPERPAGDWRPRLASPPRRGVEAPLLGETRRRPEMAAWRRVGGEAPVSALRPVVSSPPPSEPDVRVVEIEVRRARRGEEQSSIGHVS
jgi:hypothetical protein